jgi:hypothetical protein
MTNDATSLEGLVEVIADLEARVMDLENRDATVPPFVTAQSALEPVLARARRQLRRGQPRTTRRPRRSGQFR